MDIHPPEQPIHSWRDVALHLGIVTVGILIALGLESLVEWRHHQALANEAKENIVNELRDNKVEVDSFVKSLPDSQQQINKALQFTQELAAHHQINGSLHLGLHRSDVSDTSWTTAQAIGALTYMGYANVKTYGGVYSLQKELVREQTQSLSDLSKTLAALTENMGPVKPSEAELDVQKDRLNSLSSQLFIEGQMAQELLKRYNSVLSNK